VCHGDFDGLLAVFSSPTSSFQFRKQSFLKGPMPLPEVMTAEVLNTHGHLNVACSAHTSRGPSIHFHSVNQVNSIPVKSSKVNLVLGPARANTDIVVSQISLQREEGSDYSWSYHPHEGWLADIHSLSGPQTASDFMLSFRLNYGRRSVGHSLFVSGPYLGPVTRYVLTLS
jgi:hypothetical protein